MGLFICSLNSGSNGNCYYVGNNHEAVLIDVGISCRELERRMTKAGLPLGRVKAIFVSHEHTDHISGVEVLARKYDLPVYINKEVLRNSRLALHESMVRSFVADVPVPIGELKVIPFEKHHDAIEPYSFVVEGNDVKVGVLTDIGTVCNRVIHYFKQCHAAFLESNYDPQMLEMGGYPIHLKRRIRGGKGHLSNFEALKLFNDHRAPFMSHLLLSHLSKNNNQPEIVSELFNEYANGVNITVASRYSATAVYEINSLGAPSNSNLRVLSVKPIQLNLFG